MKHSNLIPHPNELSAKPIAHPLNQTSRTKFFYLSATLLFLSFQQFFLSSHLSAANGGKVLCTITIPDSKGEITLSLFTLLGEKLFEKKVVLPKDSGKPFPLLGTTPNNVYVIEAEGRVYSPDDLNATRTYSKASKVTTDDVGNARAEFGN